MIDLPPGWKEHYMPSDMWPDPDMRDKLAYADGNRIGGGHIYYRERGHWTNRGVFKFFIHSHERGHAWQWGKRRRMWHTKEPGIMAERFSLGWWLAPIVSLIRWSWWDKETRGLINAG